MQFVIRIDLLITDCNVVHYRIRGALASLVTLSSNFGILIGFLTGNYFSYAIVPKVLLIFPIVFLALYQFFPESPYFLMQQNKVEVAYLNAFCML